MEFLVIEAEGLPDIGGGRQVYGLAPTLPDKDVAKVMFHHHLHGPARTPFLAPHLRAVAAVSLVRCRDERLQRSDLSVAAGGERVLLQELARMVAGARGPVLIWDGGRHVDAWLTLRALIHGTSWDPPRAKQLESEFDLAACRIERHQLARRLDVAAAEIPDDETGWQRFRQTGIVDAVGRCAVNAAATASLWLRYCLALDTITADEFGLLSGQLGQMIPPRATGVA